MARQARRETLDNLNCDVGIQPSSREVIEKEEWLRALNEDVVDAVVDQVDANRPVHAGHEGNAQLGADAVSAGHQHRIVNAHVREPEQAAKRTDLGQHAARERPARERADPPHDLVTGVDVDARLLVVHQNNAECRVLKLKLELQLSY